MKNNQRLRRLTLAALAGPGSSVGPLLCHPHPLDPRLHQPL
ncbi:MAG: hypothetical protein ACLSH6_03630 [Limosilactobacillus pontis]